MKKVAASVALLAITLTLVAAPPAAQAPESDRWWTFQIGGEAVGYLHEASRPTSAGVTTSSESVIVLNRLGARVEISEKSAVDESTDGRMLGGRGEISSSRQTTSVEVAAKDGALEVQSRTGGRTYSRTIPVDGVLVGPEGLRQRSAARLKAAGDTLSVQMFAFEIGAVARITRKVIGSEAMSVNGLRVAAVKAEEQMEGFQVARTIWLDEEGRVIRQVEAGPFGRVEAVRSDGEAALAAAAAGGALPAAAYTRSLIRSNIRLPDPRAIERIKIRITHRNPDLGWPAMAGDFQTVLGQNREALVLEVRRPEVERRAGAAAPADGAAAGRAYLDPNPVLQSDDADVQRIAREVAAAERDKLAAATRLQAWTSRNLTLDLGIALAPASEVVRNRSGTCLAYAVLLASLERAAHVPSRVAMGLVYVGGIWGGHAWTEILAGRQWIPVDAAMYSAGVADAARFKFVTSTLGEGLGRDLGSLQQIYGNVDVAILEYTLGGRRVVVPPRARPFSVEGDVYRNPWLGISVRKPAGFRFTMLDSTWPDATVVGMEGPKGETIRVLEQSVGAEPPGSAAALRLAALKIEGTPGTRTVAGHPAVAIAGANRAGLAFVDGGTVWVLTAEGNRAAEWLNRVADRWRPASPRPALQSDRPLKKAGGRLSAGPFIAAARPPARTAPRTAPRE